MKALEMLKKKRKQLQDDGFYTPDYDEAIAELEALLQPKNCESCMDYKGCTIYDYAQCNPKVFSCCYYESKDSK